MTAVDNLASDIRLIKYLAEEKKIDAKYQDNSCLKIVVTWFWIVTPGEKGKKSNMCDVFSYIVEHTDISDIMKIEIHAMNFQFKFLKRLLMSIGNSEKLNILLKKIIDANNTSWLPRTDAIMYIMRSLDPRLLDDNHAKLAGVEFFKLSYGDFVHYVNEYKYDSKDVKILKRNLVKKRSSGIGDEIKCIDYSQQSATQEIKSEILFEHDDILYYGDRGIVFNSMLLFKDDILQVDKIFFDEILVLGKGLKVPKYVINLYINTIYFGRFNLNAINPQDIFQFIKFIHQYPTTVLSLDKYEIEITEYFLTNDIKPTSEIRDILDCYQFKYMYLRMHMKNHFNYYDTSSDLD